MTTRDDILSHAADLGEAPRTNAVSISEWLSRGMLTRVSVHGESVLTKSLNLSELGIDSGDREMQAFIKAGNKLLAPEYARAINSWATQCRQGLMRRHAVKIEAVDTMLAASSWSLVLFDEWDAFRADFEELNGWNADITQAMFNAGQIPADVVLSTRQQIIMGMRRDWAEITAVAREFYTDMAAKSWRRLRAVYRDAVLAIGQQAFGPEDREAYIAFVVNSILSELPAPELLDQLVYAEYKTGVLFTDSMVRQEDREMAHREAILEAERERARQALQEAVNPYTEVMGKITSEIQQSVRAVLAGYEKHGTFRGRSLEPARGFAQLYRMMGGRHLGDTELDALIAELDRTLSCVENPTPEQREAWQTQVVSDLNALADICAQRQDTVQAAMLNQSRADFLEL